MLEHGDGTIVDISFGSGCIMFPKSQVLNSTSYANDEWNRVWNNSMQQLLNEVNIGKTPPGDMSIKNRLKSIISTNLARDPGSQFKAPSTCAGNIPYTKLEWCDTRPDW